MNMEQITRSGVPATICHNARRPAKPHKNKSMRGFRAISRIIGRVSGSLALVLGAAISSGAAQAQAFDPDCRSAAQRVEQEAGLPPGLLLAIGRVETGRTDPATGRFDPWPWSTNMAGVSHYFASYAEAIAWSAAQLANGQRSIDVGCFQINLMYHPGAFATLEEAFAPLPNARYAAEFLNSLYRRSGSWQLAAAQYHSADPAQGTPYGNKVFALLGAPDLPVNETLGRGRAGRTDPAGTMVASVAYGIRVLTPRWANSSPPAPLPRNIASTLGGVYVAMPLPREETQRVAAWPPVLPVVLRVLPRTAERRLPRVFTPDTRE